MKLREMQDAARAECERHGCANYWFSPGSKHPKITMARGTEHRTVSFSGSPSCQFAHRHLARDVRKALKELGYVEISEEAK